MVDLVKWCLSITYSASRLTGVFNFEVDFKTGQTKVTRRATICAALSHIIVFIMLLSYLVNLREVVNIWEMSSSIQESVFMVLSVLRIISIFLALGSRWTNRRSFMRLVNSFHHQISPEIIPYCRRSIVTKFFCSSILATLHIIISLAIMRKQLNISVALTLCGLVSVIVIMNVLAMQYFIVVASIRGRYILLNKELQAIVAETRSLNPNRPGVFMTKCCSLADRLENIAQSQSNLQGLMKLLTRTYQVEVVCWIINYYSNLLGNLYLIFSLSKYGAIKTIFPKFFIVTYCTLLAFGLVDFWINASIIFHLLDAHEEMVDLLSERTLFEPGLDQRLDAVIDSFTLNLKRNPFELNFLGLFKINRFAAFALLNSLLTHTIILIQYDIENF